jgi:hypothetical protein
MKIAVMQPYIFPYLGYFQLIGAVDLFVFYDDVNFIKGGWINRNKILGNPNPISFVVPLDNGSSFKFISETRIKEAFYSKWKKNFLLTISHVYKKAPYFSIIYNLIDEVLGNDFIYISELSTASILGVCRYLNLEKKFIISSVGYSNTELSRNERLVDIINIEGVTHYINPVGGIELYKKDYFSLRGIKLNFLEPVIMEYKQFNKEFTPSLSIIDILMFNDKEKVREMIAMNKLI